MYLINQLGTTGRTLCMFYRRNPQRRRTFWSRITHSMRVPTSCFGKRCELITPYITRGKRCELITPYITRGKRCELITPYITRGKRCELITPYITRGKRCELITPYITRVKHGGIIVVHFTRKYATCFTPVIMIQLYVFTPISAYHIAILASRFCIFLFNLSVFILWQTHCDMELWLRPWKIHNGG